MPLTPLEAEDAIDALYGCLKDLPRNPLADLEAEHRAEIEGAGDPEILSLPATVVRVRRLDRHA